MNSGGRGLKKWLFIGIVILTFAACALFVGGWLYWHHLSTTPQYSLALLIDAAREGDEEKLNELVDTDSVVESMVPQVIGQAAELYGRGLPKGVLSKIALLTSPLLPGIKQRVRAELPGLLKREAEPLFDVPFAALVITADRYLEISTEGDVANVRSRLPAHDFEFSMRRHGDVWRISSVRDDVLSRRIAETIGQQIIGLAADGDLKKAAESLGVEGLDSLIKRAEDLLR